MAKAVKKPGTNIGGLYVWSQRDFNSLMSQLATIQSNIEALLGRVGGLQAMQGVLQGNLQAVQASVQSNLNKLTTMEAQHMSALDDLTAQVQANTNLEQSAVQAIQGIAKQLQDALTNNDSAALQALAQQLNSSAAALGSAITANTPQVNPTQAQAQHR
jgi:chromosome segregation ATPase